MVNNIVELISISLNPIAEEGREHNSSSDDEEARTDQCHDRLCHAVFACIHLYVYLQSGDDGDDGGKGIRQPHDVEHHRDHIVVHGGKGIGSPTVVHTAAFGGETRRDCHAQSQKKVS